MERIKALSTSTKLIVVSGALLFFDLFFTWQDLKVNYGPNGIATEPLDGWDFWGLLIGLAVLALLAIVIVVRVTDIEVPGNIPWGRLVLVLGVLVFVLTVFKTATDADSSWASYVGVVLAALVAVGAYLDWAQTRSAESITELEEA